MQPKVSIIIPVYNGANFMREAIDSALQQTYPNLEIIVVNDGSRDDGQTDQIARSYGDRIRYVSKENGGSSSALNAGIRAMTGEFFSWLSHDDLYTPEKIEHSVRAYQAQTDPNCIVVCNNHLINAEGEYLIGKKKDMEGLHTPEQAFYNLTHGKGINGCGVLIPKAIIDAVGFFDEQMVYLNDLDYWYRVMFQGVSVFYLNEKLVKCRIHAQQVSVRKINLFDSERHYLARKALSGAAEIRMDKSAALLQLAHFCASENLAEESRQAKQLLKANGDWTLPVAVRLSIDSVTGAIKRFLRYVRKKLLFRR